MAKMATSDLFQATAYTQYNYITLVAICSNQQLNRNNFDYNVD